jgi:hypothetical protein
VVNSNISLLMIGFVLLFVYVALVLGNLNLVEQRVRTVKQCSGSGSTCFWGSRIRIQILLSASKNSKKKHDSYFFLICFGLFIFEK